MNKKQGIVIMLSVVLVTIFLPILYVRTNAMSTVDQTHSTNQTNKETPKPSPYKSKEEILKEKQKVWKTQTIAEIIASDSRLTMFSQTLDAVGLTDTLQGVGPFTVFAPSDDAFAKLPKGMLAKLAKQENAQQLNSLLLHHIYPGKLMAQDIAEQEGAHLEMLNKTMARIKMKKGNIYIDGAIISTTDIVGTNGVIHLIDSVMVPVTTKCNVK